jgi:hypothetical protein
MIRIIMLTGCAAFVSGCLSLGVSGSANPTSNSQVSVGASVDQNGVVKPTGRVIFDLF